MVAPHPASSSWIPALLLVTGLLAGAAGAQEQGGGTIVTIENQVDRSPPQTRWLKARLGDPLRYADQVRTGELSRAAIELSAGGVLRMSEFTSLRLQPPPNERPEGKAQITFARGVAYFFSRSEEEADIKTPGASLNIRGTEFVIEVGADGKTSIAMVEGEVELRNALGAVTLVDGEQGVAAPGQAPRKTAVLDATKDIQWFLYYPGIADPAQFQNLGERWNASVAAYTQGDVLQALELLPSAPRSKAEFRYAATVKLASGRTDEVEADLKRGNPHPLATSLRSLVEVVKRPAGELAGLEFPPTPAGHLARSYALQAGGHLEEALAAARTAVAGSPRFGLGWARVAELEFSFGRTAVARVALAEALAVTPRNAQALSLDGYLLLAENRVDLASQRFAQALAIDPALGNAWLGSGLAAFQLGDRDGALRAITLAAALEPNRSLFRSYLGKAFAETGKDDRASHELGLARRLDPGDPTPPLYQAVLDQRRAAYNDGIANLEESIRLNDNRAIYRSGFLLDKDRAVREANLAALYENVGMTETSLEEARRSVVSDYLNPSAHLFLSNSFDAIRDPRRVSLRYETPWFNELLLANLFSPAGTDLLPQNISQQEYGALFPVRRYGFSNRNRYRSDGEVLSTGTARARFGRSSAALDYDLFTADGFRPNQDVERYTGYLQFKHALTNRDSLYFNLKFQKSRNGDLRQLYDNSTFDPDYRVRQEQSPVAIVGYQHQWSPNSRTLALGGVLTDRLEITDPGATSIAMLVDPLNPAPNTPIAFPSDLSQVRETEIYFGEVQHIWNDESQTVLVGTRFDHGEFPTTNTFRNPSIAGVLPTDPFTIGTSPDYQRWVAYGYYTREVARNLWATAGLAFDHQEYPLNTSLAPVSGERASKSEFLPKAGLVWAPNEEFTLRVGYARSLGGVTFDESVRLEPTQVSGFTQSFRTLANESELGGLPAPLFDTAGASVLWKLSSRTYLGAEGFFRQAEATRGVGALGLDQAFPFPYDQVLTAEENLDYREWGGSIHINQLLCDTLSVGARYTFTRGELDSEFPELSAINFTGLNASEASELHEAEAYLHWNHPDGWFSRFSARFLSQDNEGYGGSRPGDSWTQLDLAVGRRLFDNRAAFTIGILNLTDEDYDFNPLITRPEQPRERLFFAEVRMDL